MQVTAAKRILPYSYLAVQFILRDIGECSCGECVKFYLIEFRTRMRQRSNTVDHGVRALARENCYTGAINFNLEMEDNR